MLASALLINTSFLFTSCKRNDPIDTTVPTNLSLTASEISQNSMKISLSATDNTSVGSMGLYNNATKSLVKTFTGSNGNYILSGLMPNTEYSFYMTATDVAGNTATSQVFIFKTLDVVKVASTWFAKPILSIKSTFTIEQNAQSDTVTINLNNTSSTTKTATFNLNFGTYGSAVKMLRYQLANSADGTGWTTLTANNGNINFNNFSLPAGATTLKAIFAIKVNAGVVNGSTLTLSVNSFTDGGDANVNAPIGSAFADPINAGTVNSSTQATVITGTWSGYMTQTPLTLAPSYITANPMSMYNVDISGASGPAGARWGAVKLRNPYGNQIYFDNTGWQFFNWADATVPVPQSNIYWNKDDVFIVFTSAAYIKIDSYMSFIVDAKIGNSSSTQEFNSTNTTPGLFGLQLMSKYNVVIYNADNQVVDMSEVVVKQGQTILNN